MHLLYSLDTGGMELGVLKLLSGMAGSSVEPSVCSLTPFEARHAVWPSDGRVRGIRRRRGNDPGVVLKLVGLFRKERPDVVHTHAWGTLCEGVAAAKLAGVPHIVHGEHGTMETRPRNVWIQARLWRRVDRLLSVSDSLAARMSDVTGVPREAITVIRNGVDLQRFDEIDRAAARASLGIAADRFVAGTVGRLVAVKDHEGLIDAARRVRGERPDLVVLVAGDGELRAPLEARVQAAGLAGTVRFLGERADVNRVMAAMDVFILNSRSEGMSNTVLEAMASGLPVIATRVGGNPELVVDGETGILVPATSPDQTAAAILRLGADPATRRAMGDAGRLRAHSEFSLRGMLQRYAEMYASLVRNRHAASPAGVAAAPQAGFGGRS